MKIHWQVADGYVGGSRPQETEIDDEELEGLDEDEREKYIEDAVQEDFEQNITWEIMRIEP